MTWAQRKEVMSDINTTALVLLDFYYTKVGVKEYDFDDEKVAKALDWTTSTVQRNRLDLQKYGYFEHFITRSKSHTVHTVLLGHKRWGEDNKKDDDIRSLKWAKK